MLDRYSRALKCETTLKNYYFSGNKYFNVSSLKTDFYAKTSSTFPGYTMQILHGHLSGIHLFILNLKALRVLGCFISLSTKSHIFEPRYETDSGP